MQLSQSLFQEITGIPGGAAGASARLEERRLHNRATFDHRARIFPLLEGAGVEGAPVLVRNISVGGIGFLFAESIGVGDEFVIRLPTTTELPVDIQCAARWCEPSGTCGTQFAVGASFELVLNRPLETAMAPESELPPQGLEPLVDQPAPPSIEQRFDRQCATARQIRPIIQPTRLDQFLARPGMRRVMRVLTTIFWPLLITLRLVERHLQSEEGSRIRHRLRVGKSANRSRRKKPAAAPPLYARAKPAAVMAPSTGERHTPLFEPAAPLPLSPTASRVEPAIAQPGRRSIFAAETLPSADAQAPVLAAAGPIAPPPPSPLPPTASALPAALPALPEIPAMVAQPRELSSGVIGAQPVPAPPERPSQDLPIVQPEYAAAESAKDAIRPPVAHPRQPRRRRPRATFHR